MKSVKAKNIGLDKEHTMKKPKLKYFICYTPDGDFVVRARDHDAAWVLANEYDLDITELKEATAFK